VRSPLADVVVVALEQAVSAPLCTRHLADLGARVVKIEPRRGGDFARLYDGSVRGLAAHFVWLNHGKESVALELKKPEGRALLEDLLARADVFVCNLAPGAAARMDLDGASLRQRFPRLVVAEITGYGQGGPLEHKRAYDLLVQAEGGSCAITGAPGAPAKPGIPLADTATGLYALSGILAALYDRASTGLGTVLSISMLDAVAELMGFAINQTMHSGSAPEPVGLGSPMVAPYGAYPTRDGATVVLGTTNDSEWQRLARTMLGCDDLADNPTYARNSDRVAARDVLDAVIATWCAELDLAEIQHRADAAGIGNSRLNTVADLIEHSQLRERGRWHEVSSPVGPLPVLAAPFLGIDWPVRADGVPALGEHTVAVVTELGHSVEKLTAADVI
jgi:itaconate CoA-transferase